MDTRLNLTPVIAIVGRPNVGKSTLFNRLLEKKKALVAAAEGTTRDISYGHFHWQDQSFTAIDTAGLDLTSQTSTEAALKRQALMAVGKADVILMVVDATTGLMPQDRALAKHLQQSGKTIVLSINKADGPKLRHLAEEPEWLKLGFGAPFPISAANGTGVGDLLDELTAIVRREKLDDRPLPEIDCRIAIIGRPNVGKSSLLNALAGEERCLVSDVPHTTKEPQDTLLIFKTADGDEKNILLVDTVGIRKRRKVELGLERFGVKLSLDELSRADVALLLVDATAGIDVQEKKLADMIEGLHPGMLIVVNKWDLNQERDLGNAEDYRKYIAMYLPAWSWAPVSFISAKTGHNVGKIIETALKIAAERQRLISTEEMEAFAVKLKKTHHTAFRPGENRPKVYGITQVSAAPPTFVIVVKDVKTIHQNFLRFVENRLRDEFNFSGTPIRVSAREIEV